jgi:group I intron endonuclease
MGMFVYMAMNCIDGKMYIGKTEKTVPERWQTHLENVKTMRHQEYLYRAIRKHGSKNFFVQCVAEAQSTEELSRLEKLWILALSTVAPDGYNMTYGGEGVVGTPEVRKKQSLKATSRRWNEATKKKIGDYHRGKPKPPEQRAKIAAHWDEKRRARQARIAVAVNKTENVKLRNFECPDCGTKFEQVTKGVYGGHRRYCLHYRNPD